MHATRHPTPRPRVDRGPAPEVLADVALIPIEQVCAAASLGPSMVRKLVAEGKFPEPIRMGPRCTRWRAVDVRRWLADLA